MTTAPLTPPQDWTAGFRARAARSRTPISATLELTRRCNLRCGHCYLGDQAAPEPERDTAAVKASLDEWAAAGCLYLLITGGDPMLRKDFADIYRHARELGLIVTVFCNGSLVTDAIVRLFQEFPPRLVEISLYGATAGTYEAVTGVPGSHARAWDGLRRLHAAGIRIGLKTLLLSSNRHELEDLAAQARELGVPFRYDAAVFPCLPDGADRPLNLRVSPEEVVARDVATPERRRQWRKKIEQTAQLPETEALYTCGAGATGFFADPQGRLSPCLLATHYRCRPEGRSFLDVWKNELGEIRARKRTRKDGCASGALRGACAHCPAFNYLETGDEENESDYMRQTTRLRYREVMLCSQENL